MAPFSPCFFPARTVLSQVPGIDAGMSGEDSPPLTRNYLKGIDGLSSLVAPNIRLSVKNHMTPRPLTREKCCKIETLATRAFVASGHVTKMYQRVE